MRNLIFVIITVTFFVSCKSGDYTEREETKNGSISKKKKFLSAYEIIYNNNNCLDLENETLPIIYLESDTIFLNDSLKGKVYFSSNYLRHLGECNNLDYKIKFSIYKEDGKYDRSIVEKNGDTVFFKVLYNSLKKINSTKSMDEYLLSGRLGASFFKVDNVVGYDTVLPINKRFFVLKSELNSINAQ